MRPSEEWDIQTAVVSEDFLLRLKNGASVQFRHGLKAVTRLWIRALRQRIFLNLRDSRVRKDVEDVFLRVAPCPPAQKDGLSQWMRNNDLRPALQQLGSAAMDPSRLEAAIAEQFPRAPKSMLKRMHTFMECLQDAARSAPLATSPLPSVCVQVGETWTKLDDGQKRITLTVSAHDGSVEYRSVKKRWSEVEAFHTKLKAMKQLDGARLAYGSEVKHEAAGMSGDDAKVRKLRRYFESFSKFSQTIHAQKGLALYTLNDVAEFLLDEEQTITAGRQEQEELPAPAPFAMPAPVVADEPVQSQSRAGAGELREVGLAAEAVHQLEPVSALLAVSSPPSAALPDVVKPVLSVPPLGETAGLETAGSERWIARYSYDAEEEGHISLEENRTVVVVDRAAISKLGQEMEGWWEGFDESNPASQGYFPADYVELLPIADNGADERVSDNSAVSSESAVEVTTQPQIVPDAVALVQPLHAEPAPQPEPEHSAAGSVTVAVSTASAPIEGELEKLRLQVSAV